MPVTQSQIKQPLFALGRLVATPGALELLTRSEQTPLEFLARHSRGDWGLSHTQWRKALGHHRSRPKRNNAAAAKRILKLKRARKRAVYRPGRS